MKIILFRSKAILSGANGDVIKPKESEKPFWLELVRLPTGSYLECQNQYQSLAPHIPALASIDQNQQTPPATELTDRS